MNIRISRLSNGLTVVTDTMPQLESAFIGIWVDCGGRHETRSLMGISHMLEHMAFKGTERRSARAIAEEIENVGGFLNAYTSREQTAYHARILKEDVPVATDILGDILTHPVFDAGELERERQVVLQELGQARDTPDDIVFDHLLSVAYPDQAMGWPILGEEATVSAFSPDDLKAYMGANYRTGGMILVASGRVEHDTIMALAEEKFVDLKQGDGPAGIAARFVGGDKRDGQNLEQVHVVYAFPGVASADPEFYAAQVYATALGGGMSSRLFQEAREKRGLCYSIYAFSQSFREGGLIGVYAGTGDKEAGEISAVIAGEMSAISVNISEAEIARAKAQLKSGLLMGLERPSARAEQIAAQLSTFGHVLSVDEITAKLDVVDVDAVCGFGERLMETGCPAIAAVGPVGRLETHDVFAQRFGGRGRFGRAAE